MPQIYSAFSRVTGVQIPARRTDARTWGDGGAGAPRLSLFIGMLLCEKLFSTLQPKARASNLRDQTAPAMLAKINF